jgi:phage gp45-like
MSDARTVEELARRVKRLERLLLNVEIVTDIELGDNGVGTAKGLGESELDVEAAMPAYIYARPTKGAGGVVLKLNGNADQALLIAFGDRSWKLTQIEDGELLLENDAGARAYFTKDGDLKLDAKQDRDIILNDGTKKVALVEDEVVIGTLAGSTSFGSVNFVFTPANADGTPGIPGAPGATVTLTAKIKSTGGAPNVKG